MLHIIRVYVYNVCIYREISLYIIQDLSDSNCTTQWIVTCVYRSTEAPSRTRHRTSPKLQKLLPSHYHCSDFYALLLYFLNICHLPPFITSHSRTYFYFPMVFAHVHYNHPRVLRALPSNHGHFLPAALVPASWSSPLSTLLRLALFLAWLLPSLATTTVYFPYYDTKVLPGAAPSPSPP